MSAVRGRVAVVVGVITLCAVAEPSVCLGLVKMALPSVHLRLCLRSEPAPSFSPHHQKKHARAKLPNRATFPFPERGAGRRYSVTRENAVPTVLYRKGRDISSSQTHSLFRACEYGALPCDEDVKHHCLATSTDMPRLYTMHEQLKQEDPSEKSDIRLANLIKTQMAFTC